MKKWIAKAIVQKTISYLPAKHHINYFFQKYITKGVQLSDTYFIDRLQHFQQHWAAYCKDVACNVSPVKTLRATSPPNPLTTLELGTGWYPTIPIALWLSGADQIHTIDISALLDAPKMRTTLLKFQEYHEKGTLQQYCNPLPERLKLLQQLLKQENASLESILEACNINYIVGDARQIPLPDKSIHLLTSNNTFEHIYPNILEEILAEMKRVMASGGIMSHFIDMSDHFAHFDKSITAYHFLQFTENQWKWIDNSIQPMNRLRINHFKDIYEQVDIPVTEIINWKYDLTELEKVTLASPFDQLPKEDVAVIHSYFISKI